MNLKKHVLNFCALFIFFVVSFSSAYAEENASLYLSPSLGSYPIGEVFTVSVNLKTGGQKISNAEGKISFNNSELQVIEISKKDSIFTSWDSEPSFSNEEGVVKFSGLTKVGYSGDSGKILSLSFKALKNKSSTVKFVTGAAVIAADGLGTNILTSMDAGSYELTPKEVVPSLLSSVSTSTATTTPIIVALTPPPAIFTITSLTHPDSTRSYATTTAIFHWSWDDKISSIAFSLDKNPTTTPKKIYTSSLTEKIYENLDEGVSYFHFLKNSKSGSSTIIHYRIGVDTKLPDHFVLKEKTLTDAYGFSVDASDESSGIEKYIAQIDSGEETQWRDEGSHTYLPSGMVAGTHVLKVKAVDFAGNYLTSSVSFSVPVTKTPIFLETFTKIKVGKSLVLHLRAEDGAKVTVVTETAFGNTKEGEALRGVDGIYTYTVSGRIEKGTYTIWAVSNIKGVSSARTAVMTVEAKGTFMYYLQMARDFVVDKIALVSGIVFGIVLIFYLLSYFIKREKTSASQKKIPLSEKISVIEDSSQYPIKEIANLTEEKHHTITPHEIPKNTSFQVVIGKKE